MVTVSKPTLLGILALGVVLGGGATYLVVGSGKGSGAGNPPSKRVESGKKSKKKASSKAPKSDLSPREASRAVGGWLDNGEGEEDYEHILKMVSRAAEWSAESTMEQVMSIEDPYKRRDAMERLFRYWIGSDQEEAVKALEGIENVALRRDLYRDAMRWLSQDDPVAAVKLLKESNNLHDHELWARSFATWAGKDREAAIKNVLAIEHAGMRRYVLKSVGQRLAGTSLPQALEWAGTLEGDNREVAMAGILAEAANSNPQVVVANLEQIPEGRMRREIIGRAADEWAERDPEAAMEWAETLGGRERELAVGEIAETVLETDPDRAQEIVDEIPGTSERAEVIQSIARLRATANIEEAIGWIEELPAEDRSGAWSGVAREWARIDPEAAGEYALLTDQSEAREQLVASVSYSWSQRDPEEAAAWAMNLEGRTQASAMNRIVETWTRSNPEAAGDYVTSELAGDLQSSMTRQVASRWLREDMPGATAWIDRLPDGQARDGAVYTLISSIERDFPEVALQWADTIGDERRRSDTQRRLERRMEPAN